MNHDIMISRSESGPKTRYEARVAGRDGIGELTFARVAPNRVIADHTAVDDDLRGLGVGKALIEQMISDARSEGFTISPQCPFVKFEFQRNPDWSDVLNS